MGGKLPDPPLAASADEGAKQTQSFDPAPVPAPTSYQYLKYALPEQRRKGAGLGITLNADTAGGSNSNVPADGAWANQMTQNQQQPQQQQGAWANQMIQNQQQPQQQQQGGGGGGGGWNAEPGPGNMSLINNNWGGPPQLPGDKPEWQNAAESGNQNQGGGNVSWANQPTQQSSPSTTDAAGGGGWGAPANSGGGGAAAGPSGGW